MFLPVDSSTTNTRLVVSAFVRVFFRSNTWNHKDQGHDPHKSYLSQWLFTRVTPERIIHTTHMDSSWSRLLPAGNWCVVWDPPLVAQLRCFNLPRSEDTSVYTNDWCLTTHRPSGILSARHSRHTICGTHLTWSRPDHSSTPWACCMQGVGPCHSWDPAYVAPVH